MSQQQPPAPGQTPPLLHNAALVCAVLAPAVLVLQPAFVSGASRGAAAGARSRLTPINVCLGLTAFMSWNRLAYDYTGQSIMQRSVARWGDVLRAPFAHPLPTDEARRRSAANEAARRKDGEGEGEAEKKEKKKRGLLYRLWMGNETEGWQERRKEEERRAFEAGKSRWDIMMDQINEVRGKKGEGEGEGQGEAAVEKSEQSPRSKP